MGGGWPKLRRFIESSLAQEFQAHVDFQRLCEELLTNAYGDLQVLTIGLVSEDMWQAKALGSLVDHWKGITPERILNKIMKNMGDLGIEPRSQCLHDNTPSTQPNAFIC